MSNDRIAELRATQIVRHALECWDSYGRLAGPDAAVDREREVIAASNRLVCFIGLFNAGKSSLIDCLLGKPVLPVGRFPETGAVCRVHRGSGETITVHRQGRQERLPLSADTLRGLMCLTERGRRVEVRDLPERVDIVSSWLPIPDNLVLVDTPGLNDDAEMWERAMRAAESADAIVWVANSKAFLSMVEADALRELRDRRGLDGLLLICNEFLDTDDPAEFSARQGEDRLSYLARIDDFFTELEVDPSAVPFVSVSARAAGQHPLSFGGPALRELVVGNPDSNWEALALSRQIAATRRGSAHVHQAAERRLAELEPVHAAAAQQHKRAVQSEAARAQFANEATTLVDAVLGTLSEAISEIARQVAQAIERGPLARDAVTYTRSFQTLVAPHALLAHAALFSGLQRLITLYRQLPIDGETTLALTAIPQVADAIVIAVPNTQAGARAAGTAAGLAAGSVVPVLGHGIGAVVGYFAGNKVAAGNDAKSAAKNAAQAGVTVQAVLAKLKARLVAAALRCEAPAEPRPELDPTEWAAWRSVHVGSRPVAAGPAVPFAGVRVLADA